jgi:hypothetical protein
MGLSFQEKSVWVSLAVIVAAYGFYFAKVVQAPGMSAQDTLGLLAGLVLLIIIVEIALHIALAVWRRPEPADERDRLIAAKAARNAYAVVLVGLFAAAGQSLFANLAGVEIGGAGPFDAPSLSAGFTVHMLVLAVATAEAVKYGSQLVYYRRGA